jgi:putative acetyltransferase
MSNRFVIRKRIESDSAALAEIFRRSIREVASRDYRPTQIEAWVRFAESSTAWEDRMRARQVWVAVDDGQPIGFIQFDPPDHIDLTYVHPEHQRQGVATALLSVLEVAARAKGVTVLYVEASITSRPFFAAQGFQTVAPQIVTANGQEFLNYRMEKRLGSVGV